MCWSKYYEWIFQSLTLCFRIYRFFKEVWHFHSAVLMSRHVWHTPIFKLHYGQLEIKHHKSELGKLIELLIPFSCGAWMQHLPQPMEISITFMQINIYFLPFPTWHGALIHTHSGKWQRVSIKRLKTRLTHLPLSPAINKALLISIH